MDRALEASPRHGPSFMPGGVFDDQSSGGSGDRAGLCAAKYLSKRAGASADDETGGGFADELGRPGRDNGSGGAGSAGAAALD